MMMLADAFFESGVGCVSYCSTIGMLIPYNPSEVFRVPSMITLLFLIIFISFLLRRAVQLSSHNCPMEMSEEFVNVGNTAVVVAAADNSGIGKLPTSFDSIVLLSGKCTYVVCVHCLRFTNACLLLSRK